MAWESAAERVHLQPNMIDWTDHFLSSVLNGKRVWNKAMPHMVKFWFGEHSEYPYITQSVRDWHKHLVTITGYQHVIVIKTNIEESIVSKISQTNQKWLSDGFKLAGLSQLSNHELDDILGIF